MVERLLVRWKLQLAVIKKNAKPKKKDRRKGRNLAFYYYYVIFITIINIRVGYLLRKEVCSD